MQSEFEKVVAQIKAEFDPQSPYATPYFILVDGAEANDKFWLNAVNNEVLNPIMRAMPCPLPGAPAEKRNLMFGVGVVGLTEKFSYYSFADREMFERTQEKLTEKGYKIHPLVLKP